MVQTEWEIKVNVAHQELLLFHQEKLVSTYIISTAKKGVGEMYGSEQTPRGKHYIRAKIGAGHPIHTVFVRRRPTGEIFTPELKTQFPNRDWMLTRILWLCGQEPGKNRLGQVDTMRRKIYIHGASDESKLGWPASHGCIQMRNNELIELFDKVPVYTKVFIE